MRGKYSPTVNAAYRKNQNWWDEYTKNNEYDYSAYDPEGYDSYGYDKDDMDRAGNYEYEYYCNDSEDPEYADYNIKYDDALSEWEFDGVKPIKRN